MTPTQTSLAVTNVLFLCAVSCAPDGPSPAASPTDVGTLVWEGEEHAVVFVRSPSGEAIWQGDMVLGDRLIDGADETQKLGSRGEFQTTQEALLGEPDWGWPSRVIPYVIDPALPEPERVIEAIAHWEKHTRFTFVPHRGEQQFIRFQPDANGCYAHIGRQTQSATQVWLADNCTASTVVHEIGHAVGVFHEQARPDRDQHIDVFPQNIESGREDNFEITDFGQAYGPYDTESVMHYTSYAFSQNGEPTILRKDGSTIEGNDQLSNGDVLAIERMHNSWNGCEQVARVAGPSRFETAVAISKHGFPSGAAVAVLVGSSDSAQIDAVSAGPLAHSMGGPVLLTGANELAAATRQELSRLGVNRVYLVGGPSAISQGVAQQLSQLGYQVERLAGPTRYETAAVLAAQMGAREHVFVVGGHALPDAVAASAAGASLDRPVLLVDDGQEHAALEAIENMGATRATVIGGPNAVSEELLRKLPNPTRIAGNTRYSTARRLAEHVIDRTGTDALLVARGDVFVDAIVGGALARPLVLSPNTRLGEDAVSFFRDEDVATALLLGGENALSNRVLDMACYYR